MRGVTRRVVHDHAIALISTRTPHAGSDRPQLLGVHVERISTRTPHAGSD